MELSDENILEQEPPSTGHMLNRTRFLAKALAYGVMKDLWTPSFQVRTNGRIEEWLSSSSDYLPNLHNYLENIWNNEHPKISFLAGFEYVVDYGSLEHDELRRALQRYRLTPKAFALLEKPLDPPTVFISYSNEESSAFALLLTARMEANGINPFLDVTDLKGGEQWEQALANNIKDSDGVVVLIGPSTLESENVRKEIEIALREKKLLIPVLHKGCIVEDLQNGLYFANVFKTTQCIRVEGEKARYYNLAVLDVLNVFGVNP